MLYPNVPNPFNARTEIRYALPVYAWVRLVVFDMAGRRVRGLVEEVLSSGPHRIRWDGKDDLGEDAASGVYIYRLTINDGQWAQARTMLLLR